VTRKKIDSPIDNKIQTPSRKYPQAPVVGVGAVVIERD